jgi:hypothetical protein
MRIRFDASIPLADPVLRGALIGVGTAGLGAARWFPFGALPPLCSFKAVTGLPCLSCGMTRSWVHLVHGRLAEAWSMSPLGAVLCVLTGLAVAYGILRSVGAIKAVRADMSSRETLAVRTTVILVVLLNWGFVLSAGRA